MSKKTAIIIGAGPAGLTAAYEFLKRTDVRPLVLEASDHLGGIARTVNYKGNRIDIGGHRFFSKSDRVMNWWREMLPIQGTPDESATITYQQRSRDIASSTEGPDPDKEDRVMLIRNRISHIYYLRRLFRYPVSLSADTLQKLGILKTLKIGFSYMRSLLFPIRKETNLEEFFINRFGRELYRTFFKSYTEKVWGVDCTDISAEWGAQRIKGLSIAKTITHFLRRFMPKRRDLAQKDVETSLIERFLYPKFGPGQMWQETARQVENMGGEIRMRTIVEGLRKEGNVVTEVEARNLDSGEVTSFRADYVISTMPIKDLVRALGPEVPEAVKLVSEGLVYRDFITVGLLVDRLNTESERGILPDNWIYIQEPEVKLGRLQIFNNWSPYLVSDPNKVWLGLEYFCNEGDELWNMSDEEMAAFATEELARIDLIEATDVADHVVIRMPKTYPAYFGTYGDFDVIRDYLDPIENLFLVGRNGMHRYNNQDHSMLTAMVAVDHIEAGISDKSRIWAVNTEMEYHEEKAESHAGEENS